MPPLSDPHDRAADEHFDAARPLLADAALMMRLVELADSLQRDDKTDFPAAMQAINASAVAMVSGAQYAGVTVSGADGSVTSLGATDPSAALLVAAQGETGEGPCLSAARDRRVIRIEDLQQDDRWPQFRREALSRTAVRSMLCVHMFGDEPSAASLTFQADVPHAFTDESVEMAQILAAHTTMAWNLRRREQQFSTALDSRDIIGQAKGMLMERFGIDALDAFELLKKLSQETNTKLTEVAQSVVADTHPRAAPKP